MFNCLICETEKTNTPEKLKTFQNDQHMLKKRICGKTLDNNKSDNFKSLKPSVICLKNNKKIKSQQKFCRAA